jgi:hypothetical protein
MMRHGHVDKNPVLDFSSTYFEGEKAGLSAYGYSRDKEARSKRDT